jgi:hypothetical protein
MYVAVRRPTRCAEQRTIRGSPAQAKKVPSQLNNTKRADQSKGMYWTLLLSLSLSPVSFTLDVSYSPISFSPVVLQMASLVYEKNTVSLLISFHFWSSLVACHFRSSSAICPWLLLSVSCLSVCRSPSPVLTHVLALYLVVCCSFIFQPKTVLSRVICCSCHLLLPSSYPTVLTHRTVVVLPHSF